MRTACYGSVNGPEVSPETFMEKAGPYYKEHGVFPYCPACKEQVDVYGVNSPNVESRFEHKNMAHNADPMDDCILANRNSRFKGMRPEGWDRQHGEKLRSEFFEDVHLKSAYAFMLILCGKGCFPLLNTSADFIWKNYYKCKLQKVYSDSGKLVKSRSVFCENPMEVSSLKYKNISAESAWISDEFLKMLKNCS